MNLFRLVKIGGIFDSIATIDKNSAEFLTIVLWKGEEVLIFGFIESGDSW
jgi:hypothetical protein